MGLSNSKSSSSQATTNYQLSGGGTSGSGSPSAVAGGNVEITDAGQTANAIDAVRALGLTALTTSLGLVSDANARAAQSSANTAKANTDLLSTVLAGNAELAGNVQSGGATIGLANSTKLIYAALALAAAVVAVILFRHK